MRRMIVHANLATDYLGYPRTGPQLGGMPRRARPRHEGGDQPPLLRYGESGGWSCMGLGLQRSLPASLQGLLPP